MSKDDFDDATGSLDDDRHGHNTGNVQRSGATIVFWVLTAFLVCLGVCVVLSVLVALIKGT